VCMERKLLTILFILFVFLGEAQDRQYLELLNQKINVAKTDSERIYTYCELADYYSLFKLNAKSDSVLQRAFSIAQLSDDKELVLNSLFSNDIVTINSWNSKETFEKLIKSVSKGLEYAQALKRKDYIAIGYIRLAGIYRKRQQYDKAMQLATQAFTSLNENDAEADSIKCVLFNELGDIFLANGDAISSYKNYANAFEIAYKLKNTELQSEIYHHFSELYKSLGNENAAENNLMESMKLNKSNHYDFGLLKDYLDLARLTSDSQYIYKIAVLADELKSERYKEYAKRLMFSWFMVQGQNSDMTLDYFFKNPTLGQYYKNQGNDNYYWNLGNIYLYAEKYDSALYYFKLAEGELNKNYDNGVRLGIYSSLGETYSLNHNDPEAINYYEKAFQICKEINSLVSLPGISASLSDLYARQSNYKQAYYYDKQADSSNTVINENSAKDKLALLQVDLENKKRENDLLEIEMKKHRMYDLQIIAITILLASIFMIMLLVGMFKVSRTTIKMLGYFAFISLFEFIILLIDPFIVRITDGEPLKIWIIKIVIIALLVPFQHFMEHHLIQYLSSRKLLEARSRFSWKKLWSPKKEAKKDEENNMEEDTAVL
jgi:tetratricopeptide (TPR) repeat protein